MCYTPSWHQILQQIINSLGQVLYLCCFFHSVQYDDILISAVISIDFSNVKEASWLRSSSVGCLVLSNLFKDIDTISFDLRISLHVMENWCNIWLKMFKYLYWHFKGNHRHIILCFCLPFAFTNFLCTHSLFRGDRNSAFLLSSWFKYSLLGKIQINIFECLTTVAQVVTKDSAFQLSVLCLPNF